MRGLVFELHSGCLPYKNYNIQKLDYKMHTFTQMFLLRCLSSFYKRDIQSSVVGSSAFQEIKNTINEHLCDLSLSHEHFCGLWDGIISYCK